jgi:hypothetical protein
MYIIFGIVLLIVIIYIFISNKNVNNRIESNGNNMLKNKMNTVNNLENMSNDEYINVILQTNIEKLRYYLNGYIKTMPLSSYPSQNDVKRLINRIKNTTIITRDAPMITNNKPVIAQTHDKGKIIEICITDSNDKVTTDTNTMMYILLHEMTHIMCISHNEHDDEFKKFHLFLINAFIESGIYNHVDYKTNPVNYCGQLINDSD